MASADLQYIVVPVGAAVLNDSLPDAKVGLEVLREARSMLARGLSGTEVLAALSVKWGAAEVISAIAAAVGQHNFVEAVRKGRLYSANADPEEAS